MSNALLKSRAKTRTYEEFVSMEVIVWSKVMSAAVVDPVERKANNIDQ